MAQQLIPSSFPQTREHDPRIARACKRDINEDLRAEGLSAQDRAQALGVSERTLRRLSAENPKGDDPFELFFESPEGLAFIRNLLVALYVVVVLQGKTGPGAISEVFELCQLSRFVANSVSTHQRNIERTATFIRAFAREEIPRLADLKPRSQSALVGDEMFRRQLPILVALDAASNYLFLESIEADRTCETWMATLVPVLESLNVEVTSFTGDGAKALIKLAEDLGVPYAPDNAHVAGDIAKGLANSLEKRARKAKAVAEEESLSRSEEPEQPSGEEAAQKPADSSCKPECSVPSGLGVQPETAEKSSASPEVKTAKGLEAEKARERANRCKAAMRDLRNNYHPIDLETGEWRSAETLRKELEQSFVSFSTLLEETKASQAAIHRIAKAERAAAGFAPYLQSHHDFLVRVQEECGFSEQEREAFEAVYKAHYLELVAERERDYECKPSKVSVEKCH